MKNLSVVIPTYNMEKLLPRCLDSLVSTTHPELLDVIIVNDGSKDHSLDVARKYESNYPELIRIIDKSNGNYGSTINAALPIASGKYFKILDADDRYDTEVLDDFLVELSLIDCDMIVTHFTQLWSSHLREVVKYNTLGREVYEYSKVYQLDDVLKDGYIRFFLMHSLTYRTTLLIDMNYHQTEGISYTDTEFASYPVFYASTVTFLNKNLYQYYLDREGQTMNSAIMMKSIGQLEKLTDKMIDFYENFDWTNASNIRKKFLKQYYENRLRLLFKLYLLDMPRNDFLPSEFERVFSKYNTFIDAHDMHIKLYPENKILRFNYIKYWKNNHKRWPEWFETINYAVDKVVKRLYVALFRR